MHTPLTTRLGAIGATVALAMGALGLATAFAGFATSSAAAAAPPPATMYVGNEANSIINSYPLPSSGNVAPSVTLSSGDIGSDYSEAIDAAGDLWQADFVPDAGALNEFTPADLSASNSSPPAKSLTSSDLNGPVGLAFTPSGGLWVANYWNSTLVMFTAAELAAGGAQTPPVLISSAALESPEEITLDGQGDLWVASIGNSQIQEYTPTELAASGSPTPAVTITGPALESPEGLAFDNAGDLWVGNEAVQTMVEYTPAQLAATGTPAPAVTISDDGTTPGSIDDPYDMEFDSAGNLWIPGFGGTVSGFAPSQLSATGSPVPANKLTGANTALSHPAGLALADPPQAPTHVTVTVTGSTASATWQAPLSRVFATDYLVTPIINGVAQPTIDTHSASTAFSAPYGAGVSVAFTVSASNVFGTGPASTSNKVAVGQGYWLAASDGGIFTHGNAGFFGSQGATPLNKPIVGMAATPDGQGYWLVASDGGIFTHGDAGFFGSQGATPLNKPIVGMAATPDGQGYWLVASDGGIFTHGDAGFFGSQGATPLNKPIVGMASTPDGKGYWLVASDGGIFTHGDAGFFGSQGATPLNKPIVGMAATPDGLGYWLVASDGGIFTHGDAGFFGSQGATPLNKPILGMAATSDGLGYWLVASDGGIFTHGDATFLGSQGATPLNKPIVGMAG